MVTKSSREMQKDREKIKPPFGGLKFCQGTHYLLLTSSSLFFAFLNSDSWIKIWRPSFISAFTRNSTFMIFSFLMHYFHFFIDWILFLNFLILYLLYLRKLWFRQWIFVLESSKISAMRKKLCNHQASLASVFILLLSPIISNVAKSFTEYFLEQILS